MKREALIDELVSKLNSFSFYNQTEFEELKLLSEDDINCDSIRAINVTPLLETIGKYAVVYCILGEEKEEIKSKLNGSCDNVLDGVFEIAKIARDLFSVLLEEKLFHPVILLNNYKIDLIDSLNQSFDCIYSLLYDLSNPNHKDNLINLLNKFDSLSVIRYEKKYEQETVPSIFINGIRNKLEEVMNILVSYSTYKAFLEGGLGKDLSLCLSDLSFELSTIKEENKDATIVDYIDAFNNRYLKNKSLCYIYRENLEKTKSYKQAYKKLF